MPVHIPKISIVDKSGNSFLLFTRSVFCRLMYLIMNIWGNASALQIYTIHIVIFVNVQA